MASEFFQVTLGNLVAGGATILSSVVTVAIVWQKMKDELAQLKEQRKGDTDRVERLETQTDKLAEMGLLTTVSQHERRLLEIEKILSLIPAMQTNIAWIMKLMKKRSEEEEVE